jgi:hypothetical protein
VRGLKAPGAIPAGAYVATLSFTYNVGKGAFCMAPATSCQSRARPLASGFPVLLSAALPSVFGGCVALGFPVYHEGY